MDAATMKKILETEYGIYDEAGFNAAVSKSAGINLGIFTMPRTERRKENEFGIGNDRRSYGKA